MVVVHRDDILTEVEAEVEVVEGMPFESMVGMVGD